MHTSLQLYVHTPYYTEMEIFRLYLSSRFRKSFLSFLKLSR